MPPNTLFTLDTLFTENSVFFVCPFVWPSVFVELPLPCLKLNWGAWVKRRKRRFSTNKSLCLGKDKLEDRHIHVVTVED